jgi:peptide/nickel transport system ATP-binding protein
MKNQVTNPILELRNVSKRFGAGLDMAGRVARLLGSKVQAQVVHAVDDVSLTIQPGEVVGLVGESGCGKSTLGRIVAGLHGPTAGQRFWKGDDVTHSLTHTTTLTTTHTTTHANAAAGGQNVRPMRRAIQMIFQDPYASLNPRMRVLDCVGEAPLVHGLIRKSEQAGYVAELLQKVGLDAGSVGANTSLAQRFPHQFSGGQRARIGIARALAVQPELLVCDEAVAALDVSIQAQVLNLFMRLRDELQLTYLFISHDLGVVRHLADRVVIMYLGRVVESAMTDELFAHPNHPYAQALLAEAPTLAVKKKIFMAIQGEMPSPLHPPSGCHFHPRCPHARQVAGQRCQTEQPRLKEIAPQHFSACHLNNRLE